MQAEPPPLLTIFFTGQPKLMSMKSGPSSAARFADSAMAPGSAPNSWMPRGRSSSPKEAIFNVFSLPRLQPSLESSSVVT